MHSALSVLSPMIFVKESATAAFVVTINNKIQIIKMTVFFIRQPHNISELTFVNNYMLRPVNKYLVGGQMRKFIKNVFILSFLAGTIYLIAIFVFATHVDKQYKRPTKSAVFSSDNIEIGQIATRNSTYVGREQIPNEMINAVVSVEDKRFYSHFGVDVLGIARALYVNFKDGHIVEGGSTITQQVATLLYYNKSDKSYIRKIKEGVTAMKLESRYTKDQIVTMYLNEVYFGANAYGIYEAAQTYFSKQPLDLTLGECALLAGIISAPSANSPTNEAGLADAIIKRNEVLEKMRKQDKISEDTYNQTIASSETIHFRQKEKFKYGTGENGISAYLQQVYEQSKAMLTSHLVSTMQLSEVDAALMAETTLLNSSARIDVTLNSEAQKAAIEAMNTSLEGLGELADCAFVFMNSDNGDVICYYGSDSYYDMVAEPRQPGSTIKPLYMAYLIDEGIADVNTVVNDERFDESGYSPPNSNGYKGYVTMRDTLVDSLNAGSRRFFSMADQKTLIDYVKNRFQFTTIDPEKDYVEAFSLGGLSKGLKPIELAAAYGAINNGGTLQTPNYVRMITLDDGSIIYPEKKESPRVMLATTASQLKSALESVVIRGTGKSAATNYSTMGKTGTTDKNKDVWFSGATGNMVGTVWNGNNDSKLVPNLTTQTSMNIYKQTILKAVSMELIPPETLTKPRKEDLTNIMVALHPELVPSEGVSDPVDIVTITITTDSERFFSASQVVSVAIDSTTGKKFNPSICPQANRTDRYFLKKDAPTEYCDRSRHLVDGFLNLFRGR
jgi:penicillin-binding protein 1A